MGGPVCLAKIFDFLNTPNQWSSSVVPARKRGVSRSSRTWGRDVVDATASARKVIAGRVSVSGSLAAQDDGADAYGKTVWSWHPLLVSSRWRFFEPNRVSIIP